MLLPSLKRVCHPCAIGGGFRRPLRPLRLGKTLNLWGLGRTICPPASVDYAPRLIRNQVAGSSPAGGSFNFNRKLKQVVAGVTLDKQILKKALGKKW
jgi:hypothetical protein